MYYAQQVVNTGTVLNPTRVIKYWSFESKEKRDLAVYSNTAVAPTKKTSIPKGSEIKIFSHFKESLTGIYLFLREKG